MSNEHTWHPAALRYPRPAHPHEIPTAKPLAFGRYVVEGSAAYEIAPKQPGLLHTMARSPLSPTPETYATLQAAWCEAKNVRVGTRVRVVGKAKDEELGWDNWWVPEMDPSVGREMVVTDIHETQGIMLDDYCQFPFHVLVPAELTIGEKIVEAFEGLADDLKSGKPIRATRVEHNGDGTFTRTKGHMVPAQPPAPTDAKEYDETGGESGWVIAGLQKQITALREAAVGDWLKELRTLLVACDSELSAQGHGRPASGKEELREMSWKCRTMTRKVQHLDAVLAQVATGEVGT